VCELEQLQQDQAQCRNQEVTPTVAHECGPLFQHQFLWQLLRESRGIVLRVLCGGIMGRFV
jgi:hypothetical protein